MRSLSIFVCVVLLAAVSWMACLILVGCVADREEGQALEYYIRVTIAKGQDLVWPATAPKLNQTVVVMPAPDQ